jgi:serine/threonine-protein kinase HipA
MADDLAVWLYGINTASIEEEQRHLRLTYSDDALRQYPLGLPLLSLSLPLRPERYTHGLVRPFLDGLLPEGEARAAIARDLGLGREDTYGLIRALGRDCAGALVIQPADEPSPPQPTTLTAEPLDETGIAELVANLRNAPLGVGGRVRISLAGVQEKLLLTRMPDGTWGRPVDGTPSTHILKPEIERFPHTVENEAFCMRLARNLGLPTAKVETMDVAGRKLLVVERYDRVVHSDGSVVRIHQEDFCQATGILPDHKYQENGGPSLRAIADILQAVASPDDIEFLLRATTLNVAVANGDAHGKNFSLLHGSSGTLHLAPLYDLMSTLAYGDNRLAMYIDTVQRTDRVTGDRIINEAATWGLSRRRAAEIATDVLDRLPAAADAARDETDGLQADIPGVVAKQVEQLRSPLDADQSATAAGSRPS